MMIMHCFSVGTGRGDEKRESPHLWREDIVRLQELFPKNPVWDGRTSDETNVYHIDMEQSHVLYDAMVQHYAAHDVDDEQYPSDTLHSTTIMSSLRSVFDEMIRFFEQILGFTCSEEMKRSVAAKQAAHRERVRQAQAKYLEDARTFFKELGVLKPPTDPSIQRRLEEKLGEYRKRLDEWKYQPLDMMFRISLKLRDSTFKALLVETLLNATEEVNLLDLWTTQLGKYDHILNADEFYNACAVISVYLGTPLRDSRIDELIAP